MPDGTPHPFVLSVTFTEEIEKPLEGLRILLVEDSRVIRGIIANTLTEAGCKVKEAKDGMEAIAVHRNFRPDLTLMDINMPKMGGLDAMPIYVEQIPMRNLLYSHQVQKKTKSFRQRH